MMLKFLRRISFALTLVLAAAGLSSQALAQSAKIEFSVYKAGFIVGVSGGSGTLHYKGKTYPLSLGGVSLGATIGASKADLVGDVFNLTRPEDIVGTYTSTQAGLAVAGGSKVAKLTNSKGVVLQVKGKQIGLEFSLDLSGLQINLK